jgi:hypothetical protein
VHRSHRVVTTEQPAVSPRGKRNGAQHVAVDCTSLGLAVVANLRVARRERAYDLGGVVGRATVEQVNEPKFYVGRRTEIRIAALPSRALGPEIVERLSQA